MHLAFAWYCTADPDALCSTLRALKASPECRQHAVIANDLHHDLGMQHSDMTAALAPQPEVFLLHHEIAQRLGRAIAQLGRHEDKQWIAFWPP
jgi:hypothetical protein